LSSDQKTRATAKIEVHTYEPETYENSGGGTDLVEIHVTEAFHGDIEAEGVVRFLQAIRADGSASFVGIERVSGSITGRSGVLAAGRRHRGRQRGQWYLVRRPRIRHGRPGRAARRGRIHRQPR